MPVYANSGGGLGAGLLAFGQGLQQGRSNRRADDEFQQQLEDRLFAKKLQAAQLAQSGVHILAPGESQPFKMMIDDTVSRAPMPSVGLPDAPQFDPVSGGRMPSRAAAGAGNIPGRPASNAATDPTQSFRSLIANMGGAPSRGPRYEIGNGYYIDHKPQWDQQDAATSRTQSEKLFEAAITESLANAAMGRDVTKAGLLAPIEVGKARDTAAAVAPINVATAVETARGTAPIRTREAIETARGTAPIRTQEAINTARGTAPIEVGKALSVAQGEQPLKLAVAAAGAANRAPTDGERQAASMLPEIEDARTSLDTMSPDILSQMFGKGVLGNYAKSDAGRQFQQKATQFINNTIYLKSGKAITADEFKRVYSELVPEPGDDAATLAQKKNARDLFVKGAYISAGRAAPGRAAPTVDHAALVDELIKRGLSDEQIKAELRKVP